MPALLTLGVRGWAPTGPLQASQQHYHDDISQVTEEELNDTFRVRVPGAASHSAAAHEQQQALVVARGGPATVQPPPPLSLHACTNWPSQ
jgi:hypothetical protein